MAQQPQLSSTLIEKGRAAPINPAEAVGQGREAKSDIATMRGAETPISALPHAREPASAEAAQLADPPLQPAPIRGEATRQLSFRASVFLQSEMRDMLYETGRSQQDIMTEFMTDGFRRWRETRRRG